MAPIPEHRTVLHHLVGRFAVHVLGDVLDVVAAVLLVGLDELIEVALRPVGEA